MSEAMRNARVALVWAATALGLTTLAQADLVNGDFSSGGAGWATSGVVFFFSGTASFWEDLPYGYTDSKGDFSYSTLMQDFSRDSTDTTLEFDFKLPGIGTETDYLQLLLNGTVIDVASTSSADSNNDGNWHHWSQDLSAMPQGNTSIIFRLKGYDDILDTTVEIDNVAVTSVVPLPGAFILGNLGLGLSGWRLRRRRS